MQDIFENNIHSLFCEIKPRYILSIGNHDGNFVEKLLDSCKENEIFLNIFNPLENINIEKNQMNNNLNLINRDNFNKILMLNNNDVILIDGTFHFDNLYDKLKYILESYSPKEFPFIIFYNTIEYSYYEMNDRDRLKSQYNNEISLNLKKFIIDMSIDLVFYSTFMFNGMHILCSNSKKNKDLIYNNFIKNFKHSRDEKISRYICFETKNINDSFDYETLFINTQLSYSDIPIEHIENIIHREVVLTNTKKDLYGELIQKENTILELNNEIQNIIHREVVLTNTKKDLYDELVKKDKNIDELKDIKMKLHNNLIQKQNTINKLNNELQEISLHDMQISKNNNELQNILNINKNLINELNDNQENLKNILIQKDTIINDLNNQLSDVKKYLVMVDNIKQIQQELIQKEETIKKLKLSNQRMQDILIQNKNDYMKLKKVNEIYASSNSWKITAPLRKIKKSLK